MGGRLLYEFEDVGDDLPRPPLAAMRALLASGVVLSPRGWETLGREARWALATAGVEDRVDVERVQNILRGTKVSELRLVPRLSEPDEDISPSLATALGPGRRISSEQWRSLRGVDRYVLSALATNTRLLWRAVNELFPRDAEMTQEDDVWKATVAHCEVELRPDVIDRLRSASFLDGRAFMLARTAGVRSARRASETFDLRSEGTCGPVELDWVAMDTPGRVLWQAHVSMWDGAFFPAASMAAAAAAAVALCDIAAELDPDARIAETRIATEAWSVGSGTYRDGATVIYRAKPGGASGSVPPPRPTQQTLPPQQPTRPVVYAPPPQEPMPAHAPYMPMAPGPRPGAATMEIRLSSKLLLGLVLGLMVLTFLLAAAIIAVVLSR